MVTGRARSQSRPVRRLSTRAPASIASITRARKSLEYGLDCPLRIESVPTNSLIDKPLGIPNSTRRLRCP